jgi:hypothetical protein
LLGNTWLIGFPAGVPALTDLTLGFQQLGARSPINRSWFVLVWIPPARNKLDLAGLGRLTLNVQAVGYPALGEPVDGLLDRLLARRH